MYHGEQYILLSKGYWLSCMWISTKTNVRYELQENNWNSVDQSYLHKIIMSLCSQVSIAGTPSLGLAGFCLTKELTLILFWHWNCKWRIWIILHNFGLKEAFQFLKTNILDTIKILEHSKTYVFQIFCVQFGVIFGNLHILPKTLRLSIFSKKQTACHV